jgi:hypothetical protein
MGAPKNVMRFRISFGAGSTCPDGLFGQRSGAFGNAQRKEARLLAHYEAAN